MLNIIAKMPGAILSALVFLVFHYATNNQGKRSAYSDGENQCYLFTPA